MYLEHFGLAQYPFSLTPNTRFFLKLPSHQEAFDVLVQALQSEGNFSKIVGEVGTGKTMLCRKALNAFSNHRDRFVTAYIPHPILNEEALLLAIAEELEIECDDTLQFGDLIRRITASVIQAERDGKRTLVFVDEAQAMPEESLNAIFLLTQAQGRSAKPMQVILFGQPELDELLNSPMLSQLKQGISLSYTLPPMARDVLDAYIQNRLQKSGYSGAPLFSTAAIDLLFR